MNRRMIRFGLLFLVLLFLVTAFVTVTQRAQAQENPCPPGQEEQNGCKWVQNQRTGRCRWLPAQAVAWPWIVVPVGTCPPLAIPTETNTSVPPTATNTNVPPTATSTTVGQPTATSTTVGQPTATSTDPGEPNQTPLPTPPPHPPREQPGGPGNLGYLLGSLAILAGLAGGSFWWLRTARKGV